MSRIAVVRCDICDTNPAMDDRGVCSQECFNKKYPPLPPLSSYNDEEIISYKSLYQKWCTIV